MCEATSRENKNEKVLIKESHHSHFRYRYLTH